MTELVAAEPGPGSNQPLPESGQEPGPNVLLSESASEPNAPLSVSADEPGTSLRRMMARLRRSAVAAAPAIGLYLGLRMICMDILAAIVVYARSKEPGRTVFWDGSTDTWRGYRSISDVLLSWDGRWYSMLAEQGYQHLKTGCYPANTAPGCVDENGIPYTHRLAFFPLYSYLARPFTFLPGMNGARACLLVSLLAAIAAAWGLFAIGNHLRGRRFGILLAGAWALIPGGMVQSGAFTESLFTALSAWALYCVLTRRWMAAATLTALAGLSRPTAAALVGTVCVAAFVAAMRGWDGWRPYAAMLLAPLGYVGWVLFAGHYLGGVGGFFEQQRNFWDAYFDYGKSSRKVMDQIVLNHNQYNQSIFLLTGATVVAVALFTILAAMHRTPWVLILFGAAMFIGALGSHGHFSVMERQMVPVFPALIIPALALSKAPFRTLVVLLPALAALSGWYAGWLPFTSGQVI